MTILNFGTENYHFENIDDGTTTVKSNTVSNSGEMQTEVRVEFSYVGDGILLPFAAQTDFWIKFRFYIPGTTSGEETIFIKGGGNNLFRFKTKGAGNSFLWDVEYWNDSVWAVLISDVILNASRNDVYDLHIEMHDSTGKFDLYFNGNLEFSFAGDTLLSSQATADEVYFETARSASPTDWAECLVADEDTRRMKVIDLRSLAAGNYTEWTSGSESEIDDIGIEPLSTVDSTVAISQVVDQKFTVTTDTIPTVYNDGSYGVLYVGVKTRMKKTDSGPNVRLMVREGSVDGEGSTETMTINFAPYMAIFALNPNTGSAWTVAQAAQAEIGVRSIL